MKCLFWYLQFCQKRNKRIRLYYYDTSSRIVFARFLGELKTPKRHFEINSPLNVLVFSLIFVVVDQFFSNVVTGFFLLFTVFLSHCFWKHHPFLQEMSVSPEKKSFFHGSYVWSSMLSPKSLYRSCAGSNFDGTEIEI